MQIHQLQPKHKGKDPKIVGRGGKKGTYSGKGGKGQTARSGRKLAPIIRELIKRYPKLKGYRREVMEGSWVTLNLNNLDKHFKDGEVVNVESLASKALIGKVKGKAPVIKILSNGQISKKLTLDGIKVSAKAKEAIEKAGGSIK